MKKFFGTDGIRGIANTDLTPELVFRVGRAASRILGKRKILVGKDPRVSSDMLEGALVSGLLSAGANVVTLGMIPTPGVSTLTNHENADAGIMISASHNPLEHNGIKIFGKRGLKLPDSQEESIEKLLHAEKDDGERPTGKEIGRLSKLSNAGEIYLEGLKKSFPHSLEKFHIALDCAYGATSLIAPQLFSLLGARVSAHYATPDGEKINLNCGATHLEAIAKATQEVKADFGIAFDGDGDRALFVTKNGETVNGDVILAGLALHWKKIGKLRGPVVTTVMANFGLEQTLNAHQIPMLRTPVGDRYVLEEMLKLKANLGGEQSGHIILLDHGVTGDGLSTALHVLEMVIESGWSFDDLRGLIKTFPQLLVNVSGIDLRRFKDEEKVKQAISKEEALLKGRGRIVVRPSGTEPLVRVMAEGPDADELKALVGRIAKTIEETCKA